MIKLNSEVNRLTTNQPTCQLHQMFNNHECNADTTAVDGNSWLLDQLVALLDEAVANNELSVDDARYYIANPQEAIDWLEENVGADSHYFTS